LLLALRTDQKDSALGIAQSLRYAVEEGYALDKYELLQIYLLTDQSDSALALWWNLLVPEVPWEHGASENKIRFSFVDDGLAGYLNERMNIKDSAIAVEKLTRISAYASSWEYREAAFLFKKFVEFFEVRERALQKGSSCQVQDSENVVGPLTVGIDLRTRGKARDSTFFAVLSGNLRDFSEKYPTSRFKSGAEVMRGKFKELYPSENSSGVRERVYTGDLGTSVFASADGGFEVSVALQISRFYMAAMYGVDDDFDAWTFALGFDAFDSEYFKVVPYLGLYEPLILGVQTELVLPSFAAGEGFMSHFSLIFKYEFQYGHNRCDWDESDDSGKVVARHRVYGGLGWFIW